MPPIASPQLLSPPPVIALPIEERDDHFPKPENNVSTRWSQRLSWLRPLASFRLSVCLFASAIAIVLAGTLAQVEKDVWEAVDIYFRIQPGQLQWNSLLSALFVWIKVDLFFPKSFFPHHVAFADTIGFYFPKGWLIGGMMMVNLLSAHLLRLRPQAQGARLRTGIGVLALGMVLTAIVVRSGSGEGFQSEAAISWGTLWKISAITLLANAAAACYYTLTGKNSAARWAAGIVAGVFFVGFAVMANTKSDALLADPSMRILYQLGKGLVSGLVLLAGCVLIFPRRAGVVLLHGGVSLLMISELVVGLQATEARMSIKEGETVNFTQDNRFNEIVILDEADKETQVTAIDASQLKDAGDRLKDRRLPFEIELVQRFKNSTVLSRRPHARDLATQGDATRFQLVERAASTGTDGESKFDLPALWVRLIDRSPGHEGQELGVWGLHQYFAWPQAVKTGDGVTHGIACQPKREYLPFMVKLNDVRKDDYLGTDTPRNYSSLVDLQDPSRQVDRKDLKIWMNNPLRYRGLTFYQSSYHRDPQTKVEATSLQVVRNSGWMLPYVACMIVVVGMGWQFGYSLLRFLTQRHEARQRSPSIVTLAGTSDAEEDADDFEPQRSARQNFGIAATIIVMMVGYVASAMLPKKAPPEGMDLSAFGRLPIVHDGREQPIDSLARNSLRIMSNKIEFKPVDVRRERELLPGAAARSSQEAVCCQKTGDSATGKFEALGDTKWTIHVEAEVSGQPQEPAELEIRVDNELLKTGMFQASLQIPADKTPHRLSRTLRVKKGPHQIQVSLKKELSGTDELRVYAIGVESPQQPALRWFLDVISEKTRSHAAAEEKTVSEIVSLDHRVFRIDDPELQQLLKLPPREGFLYSIYDFRDQIKTVDQMLKKIREQKDKSKHTDTDRRLLEFSEKLNVFLRVNRAFVPPNVAPLPNVMAIDRSNKIALNAAREAYSDFMGQMAELDDKENRLPRAVPLPGDDVVPPETAQDKHEWNWKPYSTCVLRAHLQREALRQPVAEPTILFARILDHYREDDAAKFNAAVREYQEWLTTNAKPGFPMARVSTEVGFNQSEPFYYCSILYLTVFLLAALSWLIWSKPLNLAGLGLAQFTFLLHTVAIIYRIYISGRPPVTNLYSSAVFIGWACVAGGMVVEYLMGRGIGNILSGAAGWATLLIAHFLSGTGDTFTQLQAVLDTQFWLATHVVCITLGYATTYIAGLLGIIGVLSGVAASFGPRSGKATRRNLKNQKDLAGMTYGAICFAIFFSFFGTVLGGLWADDSWGRFWGWDPKENGALIIVLWNALVLHARWGRLVHERGLMVLAVLGNIAVSWSWFGVNELGIGLHAYGFTNGVLLALGCFITSQLAIAALGMSRLGRPAPTVAATALT